MSANLPRILRRCRRERGLSLKEVAERLGVHFTTVSAWERGRSAPGYDTLEDLGVLYGVTTATLLGPERESPPSRPFRPLAEQAGEELLRTLEELRLASCVAAELDRDAAGLAHRTGLTPGRLAALGAGEATFRPAEIAALLPELAAAGEERLAWSEGGQGPTMARLPAALRRRVERLLQTLEAYLCGDGDASHQ